MAEVKVWRDQKTGNWYARRYLGTTVDGRQRRPSTVLVGAETYEQARALADEWSASLDVDWLSQGLEVYIGHVELFGSNRASGGPKPNTTDAYRRDMAKVLVVMGDRPLSKVSALDVERMNARFSTLQDLDNGRHTEVDMFAGAVVRMSREKGLEAPYCEFAYHCIKVLEEKNDGKFEF